MGHTGGVIGIDLGLLEEIIRTIVSQEMAKVGDKIEKTLVSKRESLLEQERFYIEDVCALLGRDGKKISRRTVTNYRKSGLIPESMRDISGRPYWTPEQLERAMKHKGIVCRFPE